jgi:DNA-binding NarL/FixJ family response regulator
MHVVQNLLLIEIYDDGVGFSDDLTHKSPTGDIYISEMQAGHFGLRSMEKRLKSVGGTLEIESHAGNGTLLKASFPLPQQTLVLTNREREILRFVSQGMSNTDIALKLLISRATVKSHVHHIMQKLHVHDRTQAAVHAARQGIL